MRKARQRIACWQKVAYSCERSGFKPSFVGYSNKEFDAKLDEARSTANDGQRQAIAKEANAIVAEDVPVIPTTSPHGLHGI